jgi:hypothetical protein
MRVGSILLVLICLPLAVQAGASRKPESVQQVAVGFLDAIQKQDLGSADAACVGFGAWKSVSKRGLDPAQHRQRHKAFIAGLASEFSRGATIERLELQDVLLMPAGRKIKRDVVLAVFHLSLRLSDKSRKEPVIVPMNFLLVDGAWKFWVRA